MKKLMVVTLSVAALGASAVDISKQVRADFVDYGQRAFVHYAVPAMSEMQRLPDAYPSDGIANAPVKIFAAKGEYEPGAFNVWGVKDLGKVKFELGEFKQVAKVAGGEVTKVTGGETVVFPKANLDLKVVKCWYQNLNGWYSYFADTGDFKLVPELLLNDEDLIRCDAKKKANYARVTDAKGKSREQWINPPRAFDTDDGSVFQPMAAGFQDADELKPVTIAKNQFRNFFLTAHVTPEIAAGVYKGEIILKKGQETRDKRQEGQSQIYGTIPVEIHVADYELPRPKCYKEPDRDFLVTMYSYLGFERLPRWNGSDLALAKKQMPAILRNLARHGQSTLNVSYAFESTLYVIDECIKAGLRPDIIIGCFLTYAADNPQARQTLAKRVAAALDRRYGHHNLYTTMGDEPDLSFFPDYNKDIGDFQQCGWKFFLAGEECVYRKSGYALDWFNMATDPTTLDNRQLRLWSGQPGTRYAWYANQHVGPENPALARRQNGLAGWLAGFNCFANYAHHLGPYNDDSADLPYRPMVYFYGTYNGVLDTIAWEGFREGIDDIRYATLLCELARKAQKSANVADRHLGGKAFQYLSLIDRGSADLDTCRAEMRQFIDRLLKVVKPDPVKPLVAPAKNAAESDRLFAESVKPVEEKLAKADPSARAVWIRELKRVYGDHLRFTELIDRLEQLGAYYDAGAAADTAMLYERAGNLYMKALKEAKEPGARAAAAWAAVKTHPEIFDDPAFKPCFEYIDHGRTNDYLVHAWGTWGRLSENTYGSNTQRANWTRGYRIVARIADATDKPWMNLNSRAVGRGLKIFAAARDWKSFRELTERYLKNPSLKPQERYFYELALAVLCDGKGTARDRLAAFEKDHAKGLAFATRKAAIKRVGTLANEACDEKAVRGIAAYYDSLFVFEPKLRYTVKYTDADLTGIGDWANVDAEEVPFLRQFGSSTEMMYTDVTTGTDRRVEEAKDKPTMRIVANRWGINFLFTVKTDKARAIEARRASAGIFEGYLSPGKGRPYYCILKNDNSDRWGIFNTVYDAIGQQAIDAQTDRVRSASSFGDGTIRTMLSLSWDNFVTDIPTDGSVWDFENVRWGAGGGAWNGVKTIHGRSSWGELAFALTPAERAKILRKVEESAYFRFRREVEKTQGIDRYEGAARHWNDKFVGDPAFYAASVKPFVAPLLEAGKVLAEDPTDATVFRLEKNGTLAKWHNVIFEIDRLRTRWLER